MSLNVCFAITVGNQFFFQNIFDSFKDLALVIFSYNLEGNPLTFTIFFVMGKDF